MDDLIMNYRRAPKHSDLKLELYTMRFPAGTMARADALLKSGEMRVGLFREAIERELARREKLRERDSARRTKARAPAVPS